MNNIDFPNLGLHFGNVPTGFSIGGFEIKLYGIVIAIGFLTAFWISSKEAKRTGQDPELYLDYLLAMVIPAILCARIYYVIFSWDYYFQKGATVQETFLRVINIRQGGLAIYGGLLGGILVCIIFAKKRKESFFHMMDTIVLGVPLAQMMGRWGNFFNREAFGSYTDSLFAMAIPLEFFEEHGTLTGLVRSGIITEEMLSKAVENEIWVHPTFLYEGCWNLILFIFLMFWTRRKKVQGENLAIYLFGYGLGRFLIESLRTDSLMVGNTGLRASQVLAICLMTISAVFYIYRMLRYKRTGAYAVPGIQLQKQREEA